MQRDCRSCANNIKVKRGCRALSRKVDGNCWAWITKKEKQQQEEDIEAYFVMLGVRRT